MSYLTPNWPAPKNVHSIITTKKTLPTYDHYKGRDSHYRTALRNTLRLSEEPIWLNQTHSNRAVYATSCNIDTEADASIAHTAKHIAVVFTADCLPILLCNHTGTKVAAIHAGWRGLLNGIIENSIQLMDGTADNLLAYLGPAIGPTQFEVGHDVHDAFIAKNDENQRAFTALSMNKWLANIYTLATIQLNALGIPPTQIFGGDYCTVSENELFYSYRRDQGKTGRMASLIWFD